VGRSQPARFDQTHVSLSGISAAGNLALAVASSSRLFSTAKVNGEPAFRAVFAFYPSTDLSQPTTAKKQVVKSKISIPKIFPFFPQF
jgi:acetyl esterase/lipase